MRIDVFTIFPEYLDGALGLSLLGRARELGLLDVRFHDPRAHTTDRHRSVDDAPFGGGAGMVMMPEPLFADRGGRATAAAAAPALGERTPLRPGDGRRARRRGRVLVAVRSLRGRRPARRRSSLRRRGRVGDFVLAGGEAAALVVIEAVSRLVPGVIGNEASAAEESFTRRAARVPAVHAAGRVPGLGGARGPAVGRPRPGRPVAAGAGAAPDRSSAARTCSTGAGAHRRGPGAARRVPARATRSLASRAHLRQVGPDLRPIHSIRGTLAP